MPVTQEGFLIDETTVLTKEQVNLLKKLIGAGKDKEAEKYLEDIMAIWNKQKPMKSIQNGRF